MVEYKRQHYVPQFYLRQFSNDNNVYAYHLDSRTLNRTPIANICQASYFYSDYGDYEETLSGLEQLQAGIIKKIISKQSLGDIGEEEYFHLLLFLLLQNTRTKQTKEMIDDTINGLFQNFIAPNIEGLDKPDLIEVKTERSQFLQWHLQ